MQRVTWTVCLMRSLITATLYLRAFVFPAISHTREFHFLLSLHTFFCSFLALCIFNKFFFLTSIQYTNWMKTGHAGPKQYNINMDSRTALCYAVCGGVCFQSLLLLHTALILLIRSYCACKLQIIAIYEVFLFEFINSIFLLHHYYWSRCHFFVPPLICRWCRRLWPLRRSGKWWYTFDRWWICAKRIYKALWDRNLEFLLHKEKHERTDLWEQAKQMILFDLSHFMDLIWHQNAYRVDEWIN